MKNNIDVIGDVHAEYHGLCQLLEKMGYYHDGMSHRHDSRKAYYVGDLINKGEYNGKTFDLVRAMVDNGHAFMVNGNHDLSPVNIMRTYNQQGFISEAEKNFHREILTFKKEFPLLSPRYKEIAEWLAKQPLYADLSDCFISHAASDKKSQEVIARNSADLSMSGYIKGNKMCDNFDHAVSIMVGGNNVDMPQCVLDDIDIKKKRCLLPWEDISRSNVKNLIGAQRYSFTKKHLDAIWDNVAKMVHSEKSDKITFHGHHGLKSDPYITDPKIICLDFTGEDPSRGTKPVLTAYRFEGETYGQEGALVYVPV